MFLVVARVGCLGWMLRGSEGVLGGYLGVVRVFLMVAKVLLGCLGWLL